MRERFFKVLHYYAVIHFLVIGWIISLVMTPYDFPTIWDLQWLLSYPAFLVIDYVVNGRVTYLPYDRDK
ncbi:hypothetical protein M9C81_02655 [SAR86 cluster bacterium]|nr:hypothetical protein M9C81_02655 [SAR86 cluster bacterium]